MQCGEDRRLSELTEVGETLISSIHSEMRVLYGYLHDGMEHSQMALDAMGMVESMHDKLYELAQEFAGVRGGEPAIGGLD
jgi:hypothetical protein